MEGWKTPEQGSKSPLSRCPSPEPKWKRRNDQEFEEKFRSWMFEDSDGEEGNSSCIRNLFRQEVNRPDTPFPESMKETQEDESTDEEKEKKQKFILSLIWMMIHYPQVIPILNLMCEVYKAP